MFWLFSWLHAWATLIDGLVAVLTFGKIWLNLSFKVIAWSTTLKLEKERKRKN